MASTDSDLQTDLRKRARRRLLGAIALALTAAIVLPIVMDHEPRPPAQDIAVRIPPRDAAPPLASPARDAQPDADAAEPAPPPAPPDSEPLPASRPEVPKPVPVVKPETPKQAEAAKPAPKPEVRPVPVKPAAKAEPSSTEAARAAAVLDGKTTSFALQLGVFSDAANVAKLRARSKELGFASFTEDVKLADGQTRTRVKVGPFSSRAAAEAAQRKLEAAGMRSMIAPRP
ncbi:MAG: SPOR domain-containing protein [Methyloversatilis sp.]|nr:SPOR domain-containing protein [Methyloversatilis sp.]